MAKRPVIVELAVEPRIAADAAAMDMTDVSMAAAPPLPGFDLDTSFAPVALPKLYETQSFAAADASADVAGDAEPVPVIDSYIVRGEIEEDEAEALAAQEGVIGVFADVAIEPMLICPGSAPLGTDADVERLLCVPRLRSLGADGRSVLVAIVDTGVNMEYLRSRGKNPNFDAARSWAPRPGLVPGSLPVGHGTMCAYDVCIAAPACTLLDIAVLTSTATGGSAMDGLLSDAVRAYNHLAAIMRAPRRPGEARSLVVNNSWGMFHPSWDFPVGHPGNYSDNPRHPFNLIVGTLEGLGADILFAAGNCGRDCPDGRCRGVTGAIYGANGHAKVLSVAGVDTTKQRVGYSTQGPGRLTRRKPDLCGFTHFSGSRVYAADGGTSAATPVVAGVVAAYRSKKPYQPGNPSVSPEAVRNLFCSTCEDLGTAGWDFDHGWGVIRGCAIADNLRLRDPVIPINICALIPSLCGPIRVPIDICERFPQLCRPPEAPRIPEIPRLPGLAAGGGGYAVLDLGAKGEALETLEREELVEFIYRLAYQQGAEGAAAASPAPAQAKGAGKCGCGGG
jgi:subtilisin family serine protease